jgi:hypothetical protein
LTMRKTDAVFVFVLAGLGAFVFSQWRGVGTRALAPASQAAVSAGDAVPVSPNETVVSSAAEAPARDVSAIRARLALNQHGTFVGEILARRDSNLARWADRRARPVLVWIDEHSPLAAPGQDLASNVRQAFYDWSAAGLPLAFTFIADSARAEVHVTFVDHFAELMSGRTLWTRDVHWWILKGDIQLALHSGSGMLLNGDQLHAIALHEVGHLLGLDHTSNRAAIMAPRVSALALTPEDIATMRLIYQFPPGSVKAGA